MAESKNLQYQHSSAEEFNAFAAKIRTFARQKSRATMECITTKEGDEDNANLYDIIITHVANRPLLDTLHKLHLDDGLTRPLSH